MYYTDFYYISSNGDIEHKVNGGLYPAVVLTYLKKKKKNTYFILFMNFNHFGEPQLFHIGILNVERFLIFFLTYNILIV